MTTKLSRLLSTLALAVSLVGMPFAISSATWGISFESQQEKKEVRVWVNTNSGVYHCPSSRWYGKTKQGKYMSECEAEKAGYRAAYGNPCGSECPDKPDETKRTNPGPSTKELPPAGATAQCNDGTYSFSQHRSGTCSHHGGVKRWL